MVDIGEPEWAASFAAFNQQMVPTDELGNPLPDSATIGDGAGAAPAAE